MIDVVIMAQGCQSRLPNLTTLKQLLPLETCGTTVLQRTLRQLTGLRRMLSGLPLVRQIIVVGPERLAEALLPGGLSGKLSDAWSGIRMGMTTLRPGASKPVPLMVATLSQPGNSVVDGLKQVRFLERSDRAEGTLILLGDVVYSRALMVTMCEQVQALHRRDLDDSSRQESPASQLRFYVTPDLSPGGGEVFAMAYQDPKLFHRLLEIVPVSPYTAYQPGQLRSLLWAMQDRYPNPQTRRPRAPDPRFCELVTDYTTDFDTPGDLSNLAEVDRAAYADDHDLEAPSH